MSAAAPVPRKDALRWQARREEHAAALERFLAEVRGLDEAAWRHSPAPGKWCPGQIAEHLLLAYDAMLRELDGGAGMRVRPRGWRLLLLRWRVLPRVLAEGRLPLAPAVRELRPAPEPRARAVVAAELRERGGRFDEALTRSFAAGAGRLTHPFFGSLSALQTLRLVTIHIDHHAQQLPAMR
jgi:hypothetical protein